MLLGNFSVLSKDPGRGLGGGAIGLGMNRGEFSKSSCSRRVFGGPTWESKSSVPDGMRPPYCWILPQQAGGLNARKNLAGTSTTAIAVAGGVNGEANLTGSGSLSGAGALIISMIAALTGSGTISSAAVLAFLNLAADLVGDGDLAGAATAIGHAAAALEGEGTTAGLATALGELAAAITVTGDLLTTGNIGSAVWSILIESGLTARQAMRLIAAATAGKVSGAETSTVTIRNAVDDDTDRIIATTDADGNRTAITYDLE